MVQLWSYVDILNDTQKRFLFRFQWDLKHSRLYIPNLVAHFLSHILLIKRNILIEGWPEIYKYVLILCSFIFLPGKQLIDFSSSEDFCVSHK